MSKRRQIRRQIRSQPPRRRVAMAAPAPAPAPAPDPRASLRISDPSDLLALIPYLLGFHPQESVVTVLVGSGHVILTARVDLPALTSVDALAAEVSRLAVQHRAQEIVLVVYSAADPDARSLLDGLLDELSEHQVSEAILVTGERWWSLVCSSDCCPPQGRPYEVESHRIAAEAVYAGMSVRGGRADLVTLVSGPDRADDERLDQLILAARADLSRLSPPQTTRLVEKIIASAVGGATLDECRLLQLALTATDLLLRDRAWAMITRADAHRHVQLWAQVVAVTPPDLAAAPLALLGMAGWISGDGALQNCCVERLERIHPEYSLGMLLGDISARALSPALWDELQADLRAELGLLAG
jgi:hypothetical protein